MENLFAAIKKVSVPHTYKKDLLISSLPKHERAELNALFEYLREAFLNGPINIDDAAERCKCMTLEDDDVYYKQINFDAVLLRMLQASDMGDDADEVANDIAQRMLKYLRDILVNDVAHQYQFNILKPERADQAQFVCLLDAKKLDPVQTDSKQHFIDFTSGNETDYRINVPQWRFIVQDGCDENGHMKFRSWQAEYKESQATSKGFEHDPMTIEYNWFLLGVAHLAKYMRKHPEVARRTVKALTQN